MSVIHSHLGELAEFTDFASSRMEEIDKRIGFHDKCRKSAEQETQMNLVALEEEINTKLAVLEKMLNERINGVLY